MAEVRFEQATRIYPGTDVPAVNALDLHIADGEFAVLVGPSGSGKTTALRMLAGLEEVHGGTIRIGERDVTDDPPKQRDIAMVFQNYALYPYLTVAANIAFPLKIARVRKAERDRRVHEVAEMLGLTPYLERKPGQLSGGQRQRVAMGRAIVRDASVFLMDEPLSNLDAKLRVQMRADIAALQSRLGVTTVYVTHDQAEAMTLGHRVAVLRDGFLQQFDAPRALGVRAAAAAGGWHELVLGVRPESLELAADGIAAEVEVVEDIGADAFVFCAAEIGGESTKLVARAGAKRAPARGERVLLRPVAEDAHVFDPVGGARIG